MPYRIESVAERRDTWSSLLRGFLQRCPACGVGRLYRAYLKVQEDCPHCGEALHHQRADDAPPYFTILIVGHLIVPLVLMLEQQAHPAIWVHYALWLPLTLALTFALLPRIKGAIVGLQWANRMHGFGGQPDPEF